jgi:hypothetical protein
MSGVRRRFKYWSRSRRELGLLPIALEDLRHRLEPVERAVQRLLANPPGERLLAEGHYPLVECSAIDGGRIGRRRLRERRLRAQAREQRREDEARQSRHRVIGGIARGAARHARGLPPGPASD